MSPAKGIKPAVNRTIVKGFYVEGAVVQPSREKRHSVSQLAQTRTRNGH
jgi:hypothetical protein